MIWLALVTLLVGVVWLLIPDDQELSDEPWPDEQFDAAMAGDPAYEASRLPVELSRGGCPKWRA